MNCGSRCPGGPGRTCRCRPAWRERLVADLQSAAAQRLPLATVKSQARYSVAALDARPGRGVLNSCSKWVGALRSPGPACGPVSRLERRLRLQRAAARVREVPERDDVALALVEVHRGTDDQRDVARVRRVGVELRPDQLALERARVDDDDRLSGVVGALDVGDRHCPCAAEGLWRVEPGHLRDDHVAGAEAVVPVVRPELTGFPSRFFGIQSSWSASRLPVGLVGSARVNGRSATGRGTRPGRADRRRTRPLPATTRTRRRPRR